MDVETEAGARDQHSAKPLLGTDPVCLGRQFLERRVAGDRGHGHSCGPQYRRFVGRRFARPGSIGAAQCLGPKGLGRLHSDQVGPVDELVDTAAASRQGVADRKNRHCPVMLEPHGVAYASMP